MAYRQSAGLRNFLQEGGSLKQAFAGGKLLLYSGTQPASADAAVTGTLLCTYTLSSGAHTAEVKATGGTTLVGTVGSVDTFTVNSLEIMGTATAFDTDLTTTAAAVCTKINNNPKNAYFKATSSGAVITLTAKPGYGTLPNTWVVTPGGSGGITFSGTANMSGGVNSANGLTFGDSVAGALPRNPAETWSGVGAATGTAGYFRLVGAIADAGALDSAELYHRIDGNVATSGANLNLSSTTITTDAPQTIGTPFTITEPAS